MSVTFLPLEKQNINSFYSSYKYLILKKPSKPTPPTGKTRVTPEAKKEYEEQLEKYSKSLQALESGYVNLSNNRIRTDDSDKFAAYYLLNGIPENTKIFRINPLQSVEDRSDYQIRPLVSEFEVEKEIKTSDELLDMILENYDYFDLLPRIFELGIVNDFVNKDKVLKVLNQIKTYTKDVILLDDLIKPFFDDDLSRNARIRCLCFYEGTHEYVAQLIQAGIVEVVKDNRSHNSSRYLERLIRLNWTDFALSLAQKTIINNADRDEFKANKYLIDLLLEKSEDSNVREILKLLGVKAIIITLTVKEYDDEYTCYDIYEQKDFTDMGALRSYLITEYKVPFEKASGDISDLQWDDYVFTVINKEG